MAGQPTNLAAGPQTDTSILVTWDPPTTGDPATGYVIYYQSGGGEVSSETVSGGQTESHVLSGLDSGMTYTISIVAESSHLPSGVVGPITPSGILYTRTCTETS